MMETKEIIRDFKEIKEDYKYNPDIMNPDDERVSKLKEIINTRLSVVDKTLILLYVDCQSYRKLGKRLGLSHMTCRREIVRIKNIILKEYERIQ
jgi:DNA-directed RNA polymerase specialized sigma24 family protein